jgi:tol-pal system protein YbgF
MKKFIVAGAVSLAALTAFQGSAAAQPFSLGKLFHHESTVTPNVTQVQSSDSEIRLQQLEDQVRTLTGKIEDMSFQLLQMQEQMRKTQEDNEFRFQELEGGGKKKTSLEPSDVPPAAGDAARKQDEIANVIEQPVDPAGSPPAAATGEPNAAPGETTLGSIEFDADGNPVGDSMNPGLMQDGKPVNEAGNDAAAPTATDPQATASLGEKDAYQVAYEHMLSGDYNSAESEFKTFLETYPEGPKAADASFWLGEAQFSQGKYNDAAKTFLAAHQTYGTSPKAPEMLLKLGMSLAALNNVDTACATYHEVSKRYPKASRAVMQKLASEEKRLSC